MQAMKSVTASAISERDRLITCQEGELAGRAYLVREGRRHWLVSEEHVRYYGFTWPADAEIVSEEVIRGFAHGSPAPLAWSKSHWINPPRTAVGQFREIVTSLLRGVGIEFGAGTMPVPVPLDCRVLFADAFSIDALHSRAYAGQGADFVDLSYVTSIEEMSGIQNESVDFIIASHVIEHTRNPLRALRSAYTKLKPGGSFVLFVPDKRLCFDKDRRVTPLDHLIADYECPSAERDILHYVEFFSKAFVTSIENLYDRVENAVETNGDIHFHCWTFESFSEMVQYSRNAVSPWRNVWAQPALDHLTHANEFYFILIK